jgi:hypothetical protein
MPIKKNKNHLHFLTAEDSAVLNYFTSNKKNHFCSESKLFDAVSFAVNSVQINPSPTTYLTTYPHIAVHIRHGNADLLKANETKFAKAIADALERCLVD